MSLYLVVRGYDSRFQYDCLHAVVVRASDKTEARQLASDNHGDEGKEVWLNIEKTACEELQQEGLPSVILTDFLAG